MDGTPFGRYRLIELLGRGGMGEVWRAFDTAINRVVALKVLHANFADDEVFQERFRREAQAAAGLDEPHVVPIFDFGEIDGRLYVTMRLIKGSDLQALVANGPLPPPRAVRIIEQVASALHAAHEVGLVHRDVKPSNILITGDDFAYLIDFGIARTAQETGLTGTGATIGTWSYMAPERFSTGEIDPRSDIYALTCVLHQSLTGRLPYPGDSLEQQVAGHMFARPPQPSTLRHGVPATMDRVIATGMAKDPAERYATTKDLARAAHESLTVAIRPPPQTLESSRAPSIPAAPPAARRAAADRTPPPGGIVHAAPTRPQWSGQSPTPGRGSPTQLPPPPAPSGRAWWRRKAVALLATAVLVVIITVVAVTLAVSGNDSGRSPSPSAAPRQTTLPFTGLQYVSGIGVDAAGSVYVADNPTLDDSQPGRVLKLAAGSTTAIELPFTGLNYLEGVAVDAIGNVYIADQDSDLKVRVLKLAADSTTAIELPFTGLYGVCGIAVDAAGAVYVTCGGTYGQEIWKLAAGSTTPTTLPFTDLRSECNIAVDVAGNVYLADSDYVTEETRVLKLALGATNAIELPFTGLRGIDVPIAVDTTGNVYVGDKDDESSVLKLAPGSTSPTTLPFTDLGSPYGIAVDAAGNVYLAALGPSKVLRLAAA